MRKWILLALLAAVVGTAAELRPVGVLGNSGVSGDSLVRVGPGHGPTGLAVDTEQMLWSNGGDAINCLTLDGRLVRRYPLAPACGGVASRAFCVLNKHLYFFGPTPERRPEMALFVLPMTADGEVALVRRFPEVAAHGAGVLAPVGVDGHLLAGLPDEAGRWQIWRLDPVTGEPAPAITVDAEAIGGLAVDPATGKIYCGGYWGKLITARKHHPEVSEILRLHPDGTIEERADSFMMEAIPSEFRGHISLAAGAVWDTAWYGFLGRYDRDLGGAPGKITAWLLQLGYPAQVVGLADAPGLLPPTNAADPLLLATYSPEGIYLATWDRQRDHFDLRRRFGSLPTVHGLALNDKGLVAVGGNDVQHWWHWHDGPDAPPRFSSIGAALTGGYWVDEGLVALVLPRYRRGKEEPPVTAGLFYPATGRGATVNRHGEYLPFAPVGGFTLAGNPNDREARAYAGDLAGNCLWRTRLTGSGPHSRPIHDRWVQLTADVPLPAPRDPAALANGSLAVAVPGAVACLQPVDDALQQRWWVSEAAGTPLGENLRLAADGDTILVADADHHRVLWLAADGRLVARFGETDVAGTDAFHLDSPGAIAVTGRRALVHDAGNQRLLKLQLDKD